ncbi:MAG: glycosyltransferase family 4 protein [Oscillospiraceae bacterium]|nr:glycosyltransferase family 4 protein [Oscillospiraceae bacterium]
MVKIVEVSSDTNIGGAGKCLLTLLREIDRNEFDVEVILPKQSLLKPHVKDLGINVTEVDGIADKSLDFAAIGRLVRVLRAIKPDLVHTHASMSARIAARLIGAKIVYTRHSVFEPSPKISKGMGKILNGMVNNASSDGIIAVAEAAKDNLVKTGVSSRKIEVILNGVSPVKEAEEKEIPKLYKRFGIKNGEKIVSVIARLEDIKGHEYFIDAADILLKRGINAKFVIAGTGSYEDTLKEKVKAMGLEDDVIFTGFIPDVGSLLNITYIQVNASYGTEATSLALLEGMSLGIPAVVSDFGGNPGVIHDGENGFVVRKQDAVRLAEALEKLLCDEELYGEMSLRAGKIFYEEFTAKAMTDKTEELYRRVLKIRKGE